MADNLALPIIIFALSVSALGMLLGGFIPHHWIKADFVLDMPGAMLRKERPAEVFALVPKGMNSIFDNLTVSISVSSRMGLYTNCKVQLADILGHSLEQNVCDRDGEMGWQAVAFGFGAASLLFGTVGLVMSGLGLCREKLGHSAMFSFALVFIHLLAACCAMSPVGMYVRYRYIQVKPPLPTHVLFDVDWALIVMAAASGVLCLTVLVNTFHIALMGQKNSKVGNDGDYQVTLNMKGAGVSNGAYNEVAHF